jgi:hypothetical protein
MSDGIMRKFMKNTATCVHCGKLGHLVLMRATNKDQVFIQRWSCELCKSPSR